MERIELKGWNREKLFRMYQDSDLPYIIFSARVDVTRLLAHVRARGFSFSAALAFCCTRTANGIDNFRYRFDEEGPYRIGRNVAFMTHLRENEEIFITVEGPPTEDMAAFCQIVQRRAEEPGYDYGIENLPKRSDFINFSSIPWLDYTQLFRTITRAGKDCVPKISWGRYTTDAMGCTKLTLTVQVHHGLMDGYHVGLFYQQLEEYLDSL